MDVSLRRVCSYNAVVDIAELELGLVIGVGGAARIRELVGGDPARAPRPLLAKLYEGPRVDPAAREQLVERVEWGRGLPRDERLQLLDVCTWPQAVICEPDRTVAGVLVEDLRPRYDVDLRLPSGKSTRVLVTLQHLLSGDAYIGRRFGYEGFGSRDRVELLVALCKAIGWLHARQVTVSDFSPQNVALSLTPPHRVTLLDTDDMAFRGDFVFDPVETPHWDIRDVDAVGTPEADNYKLGLAVLRILASDFATRDWRDLQEVPREIAGLLARALEGPTALRPRPFEWEQALTDMAAHLRVGTRLTGASWGDVTVKDRGVELTSPDDDQPSLVTLRAALDRGKVPEDFSDASLQRLSQLQSEYAIALGAEAVRRARLNSSDYVSAVDVETASRALMSDGRRRSLMEAIGGVMAGAGWSTFLALVFAEHPPIIGVAVAAVAGAIGLTVLAVSLRAI